MALRVVSRKGSKVLQIDGSVVGPDGRRRRYRRTTKSKDFGEAIEIIRDLEHQLLARLPIFSVLRVYLETIVLLAEGDRARELPRIRETAEKALLLLPKQISE